MDEDRWGDLLPIRRHLRYVLTIHLLDTGRPHTLAELAQVAADHGFDAEQQDRKFLSDLLRSELRRGRVRRVRRGVYASGTMPRSTEWWIRRRLAGVALRGADRREEWAQRDSNP